MQELVSFASPIVFAPPPKFRGQALYRTAPLKPPAAGYSSMGSRIPTPIYGHFQEANLLATNTVQPETGWRNGDVLTGSMDIDEPPTCQTTLLPTRSRQSSRTLPSPISESGPDTPTSATEGHLARLTVIGSDECMDVDSSDPDDSPEPFFLPLRGRKRSIAVPTEKRRFCMGYRDDCEKCKARVPGHFSHFLTG